MKRVYTLAGCLLVCAALNGCRQKPPQQEAVSRPAAAKAAPSAAPGPSSSVPSSPAVARPSGPVVFTDVTAKAGINFRHNSGAFGKKLLPETMGSGACFIDYDNDGYQDILIVNSTDWPDHKSHKSYPALYHNNHDGTFTDVTRQSGLALEVYGMGCAV